MLMWAVMSWGVIQYGNQPLDEWLVPRIEHTWFSKEDPRQEMVQRAYELWGLDFVILIECENGWRNPTIVSKTHDHWICQLNYKYNKNFINSDDFNDVFKQLEYCYEKYKANPNLWYWPNRKIHGVKCTEAVKDRFIFH